MKQWLIPILVLLLLVGCSPEKQGLTGDKPPEAMVQIDNQTFKTKLGTYCWSSENQSRCVDAIGPVELLEGKEPIPVQPGAAIQFVMDYEPQPNKFHLTQIHGDQHTEIEFNDRNFKAPVKKGVYYYVLGVWWMDEKRENVSHGDAFYNFVIEVK